MNLAFRLDGLSSFEPYWSMHASKLLTCFVTLGKSLHFSASVTWGLSIVIVHLSRVALKTKTNKCHVERGLEYIMVISVYRKKKGTGR